MIWCYDCWAIFTLFKKAEVFLLKNGVWPIGYFPLAISLLVAFTSTNISITEPINAYYTRNVQNPSCWCIQAGKCYGLVSFGGDVDHATIGLTNIPNYSVQQFLYSFMLFWTLDSTKYLNNHNTTLQILMKFLFGCVFLLFLDNFEALIPNM